MQDSILTTVVKDIDGEVTTLEKYAGNVLLIVNVASKCGLTPQYEQLENIQKAWADRGFVVLGFPCNQFLEQEPGSDEEIKTYCTTTWGVTFPMFSKIECGDRRAKREQVIKIAECFRMRMNSMPVWSAKVVHRCTLMIFYGILRNF